MDYVADFDGRSKKHKLTELQKRKEIKKTPHNSASAYRISLRFGSLFLQSIDGNVGDGFAQPSRRGGPLQTTSISPLLPSSTFHILDTLSFEISLFSSTYPGQLAGPLVQYIGPIGPTYPPTYPPLARYRYFVARYKYFEARYISSL